MEKMMFKATSIMLVLVLSLLLLLAPIVGTFALVVYPITATVNFVTELIGDVGDIFEGREPTISDMDMLIMIVYERSEQKEIIDNVVSKYSDNHNISAFNILKPFIYCQCNEINETTINQVGAFIYNEMPSHYDNQKMIDYVMNNEPFKQAVIKNEISKSQLEYLFNGNVGQEDYIPEPNALVQDKILGYAKSKLGSRYWWGATGPSYFDCSGFVYWTHNQAGIKLIRTTAEGYSQIGYEVPFSQIQAGDVITFDYGEGVAHIGIYIGNNQMIHASGQGAGTTGQYPNECVKVTSVKKGSYFYRHIHNCRRLY